MALALLAGIKNEHKDSRMSSRKVECIREATIKKLLLCNSFCSSSSSHEHFCWIKRFKRDPFFDKIWQFFCFIGHRYLTLSSMRESTITRTYFLCVSIVDPGLYTHLDIGSNSEFVCSCAFMKCQWSFR